MAKELFTRTPVLVWVMTSPQNLDKKAVHVRNTWGKRVNKLLFMSSAWNASFPAVGLNVSEGREHLTAKTMQAFRYVYDHHFNDADWFMKADDDTYVIAENMRYMLSDYDPREPIYFGHIFKVIVKQGYASGGAGYILSKEALRRLGVHGRNSSLCRQDGGSEDAEMGHCLMRLGVKLLPSVDRLGRSRFHCFGPETHLQGGYPSWYLKYDANGAKKVECRIGSTGCKLSLCLCTDRFAFCMATGTQTHTRARAHTHTHTHSHPPTPSPPPHTQVSLSI